MPPTPDSRPQEPQNPEIHSFSRDPSTIPQPIEPDPSLLASFEKQHGMVGVGPAEAAKKTRRKKLVIFVFAIIVLLLGAGAGVVLALWYNNPGKVMGDAFTNLLTSRTLVGDAKITFEYKGASPSKGELTLTGKYNTADLNGQVDAALKYTIDGKTVQFSGSGLMSNSGNIYFKFDNASRALDSFLGTEGMSEYIAASPALKADLEAFVKKIDGSWVKLSMSDLKNLWENYDYTKAKTCYQKFYDTLTKDSKQKQQLYDLSIKYPILKIKSQSSEAVNNVDSIKYDVGLDMNNYYDALIAFQDTDFEKTSSVCDESLWGASSKIEKPSSEELKTAQETVDATTVSVWVSRWSHELNRISFDHTDETEKSTVSGVINYQSRQQVGVSDPAKSIPFSEFQSDMEKMTSEIYAGMYNYDNSNPDSDDAYSDIQARARDTERQTDIHALQKQVEAYYANTGAYPTLANILDAQWRSGNDFKIDAKALQDPIGLADIGGVPASATNKTKYGYVPGPVGCAAATDGGGNLLAGDNTCQEYALSAWLEARSEVYNQTNL